MSEPDDTFDDAFANELLSVYLKDLQDGRQRSVAEYQALFPGRDEAVRAELEQLESKAPTQTHDYDAPQDGGGPPELPGIEIERLLGRGGQGVVYLGRQSYLDRRVAVKVLTDNVADPTFRERFRREAKILAAMRHENIVACHSAGTTAAGQHYMVMEFVDGPNLREWLTEHGPMDVAATLRLALDLTAALDHALESEIIHRDVKPENVLLETRRSEGGAGSGYDVKLADLGLARTTTTRGAASMEVTTQGVVVGSPLTMAPEQFDDPERVDHRADIFALGCVLFHALAGQPAFQARSFADAIREKVVGDPPDIRDVRADVPASVAAFVSSLLTFDPAGRPQTYREVREQCERLLGVRRSPLRTLLLAAVLVLAGAATAVALWPPAATPPSITLHSPTGVAPGERVILTAKARDAAEDLRYAWRQVHGPRVALTNEDTASTTFRAPCGFEDVELHFEVVVTAGELSTTESLRLTVRADPRCRTLAQGDMVTLFSDDPFEPLRGWDLPEDRATWGGDDAVEGAATGLSPAARSTCRHRLHRGRWKLEGAMEPRTFPTRKRKGGPLVQEPTRAMGIRLVSSCGNAAAIVVDAMDPSIARVETADGQDAVAHRQPLKTKLSAEQPLRFAISWTGDRLIVRLGVTPSPSDWQEITLDTNGWHPPSAVELFVDHGLGSFRPMTQTGR